MGGDACGQLRCQHCHMAPWSTRLDACSSTRGDFPLSEVLSPDRSTWWISGEQSMPGGVGQEWLQFSFGGVRRISFVGVRIPPLPQGPLSVREFHLLKSECDGAEAWTLISPAGMTTLDRPKIQEFALDPPVDTA